MAKGVKVLNPGRLEKFLKSRRELADLKVVVGVQGDEAKIDRGGITQGELVNVLEFGSADGSIPARPVFGETYDKGRKKYAKAVEDAILKGLFEGENPKLALKIIGERYRSDVVKNVSSNALGMTPNAPGTVDRKGSSLPLVDTGQLYLRSITSKVEKGKVGR